MNKFALFSLATAAVAGSTYFAGDVFLQDTTPGTPQTGHLNITGTAKAGAFVANSTAPTGVVISGDFRTASDQGRGILGNASSPTGATYGGLFQNASNGGRAIAGLATAGNGTTYGGFFSSASVIGRAVYGQAIAASGVNYGVYGKSDSRDGFGVFSEGNVGSTGIYFGNGSGLTDLNPANLNGLILDSKLSSNVALKDASNAFTAQQQFLSGTAASPGVLVGSGSGLYSPNANTLGLTTNGSERMRITSSGNVGINNPSPTKLLHIANGLSGGSLQADTLLAIEGALTPVGIELATTGSNGGRLHFSNHTHASRFSFEHQASLDKLFLTTPANMPSPIAVESDPNHVGISQANPSVALHVTGTIAGTTKNFWIDHPQDPYNKILRHACVESDEYKNFYDGTITTDSRGYATITMPTWFSALNEKFRYQLTVLDDGEEFVLAKVTKKLVADRFTIRTSKPNVEVSWLITGIRKDGYAKAHPLEVEGMKDAEDRGKLYTKESEPKTQILANRRR